ncbi:MAG: signal recognition particle-docking protein FtsY [Deltaproteobacteria bacterium]|nr:signal recognition particle-docking protein FtsY [Deltaproteobacteria bacterium]
MGRWFRRKDQDRKNSRSESEGASPVGRESEAHPASGKCVEPDLSALEEAQAAAGEAPESLAEELLAPSPEDQAEETPQAHRGFFGRFRKSKPAEELEPMEAVAVSEPLEAEPAPPEPEPPPETPPEELLIPEEPEEEGEAETTEPRRGMFRRLRERLSRTRETLAGGLDRLLHGRKEVDALLLEELEELLITADIGVETTLFLIQALEEKLRRRELGDVERLKAALKAEMITLFTAPPPPEITARPWVVLVVGINGVGKTTTIAKLAHQARLQGLSPMLVAGDTFRAAAVEQLEIWGERVGAPVIKQKTGSDPAAVVFDGLAAAQARGVDLVFVDTAGRLHTKVNLMEELKKIHRTAVKKLPGAPHEVYLVLDATTGQNAMSQARLFHEAVGLTGLILTKMDGTAKGGVALGVVHETGIPLRYIGVGEGMEDLRPFDAEAFVEAILG